MENFWPEHAAMEVRSLKTLWRPLWKTSALTITRGKRQPKNMQPGVEPSIRERQRTNHGVWKQRRASAQQKSPARAVLPQFMTALPCPHCLRTFKAKIGLISHLRTHSTPRIWWRRSSSYINRSRFWLSPSRKLGRRFVLKMHCR